MSDGLKLLGIGFILWIIGVLLPILLPAFVGIGIVCVLFGKVLAALGVIILVVAFIRSLF